jgi:membrane-bound ClpP family serine protease
VKGQDALKLKIVDLVVEDMPSLLKQLDGRTVPHQSDQTVLHTADTDVRM